MKINGSIILVIFFLSFLTVGIFSIIIGIIPITFETSIQNNDVVGTISRRSYIPPFKHITKTIHNLDKAFITSYHSSKGGKTYKISFQSTTGEQVSLTPYSSSGYSSKKNMVDKINKSIQERKTFKIVFKQPLLIFIGCIFMLFPCFLIYTYLKTLKKSKTISNKVKISTDNKEKQKDKYQEINDSIIK